MTFDHDILIRYVFVERSELDSRTQSTAFNILSEAEYDLLRCFMTLSLLPARTMDLSEEQPPFLAATTRVRILPRFRKAQTDREPLESLWEDMKISPLVVLMVGSAAPSWLNTLISKREIAVLTPSKQLFDSLRRIPRVHVGLLKGLEDLRESYRVFRELLSAAAASERFGKTVSKICATLAARDLFSTRPRLDFVPPFPLPPPSEGRSAAYLLNRLSNNMDELALLGEGVPPGGTTILPHVFDWAMKGSAALALLEMDQPIPDHLPMGRKQLKSYHAFLTDPETKPDDKFKKLLELGERIAGKGPLENPFFVIPVPRYDLVKGKGPRSVILEARTNNQVQAAIKAVKDFTYGRHKNPPGGAEEKRAYNQAWWTLESEQRLISCQAVWLSTLSQIVSIQITYRPEHLRRALKDLNSALENNSRKISRLFQSVEILFAETMPEGLLKHLNAGSSPVLFFTDLPLEWTLVENWPICLTRPVSRIPIAFSHWDVLSAVLEHPAEIDTKKPERVLVFDLIEEHDPIRSHSDAFVLTSEGLDQKYTYVSPETAHKFVDILTNVKADIVVLDAHGGYSHREDQLFIEIAGERIPLDNLLPKTQVPPVWILSACHTSVTGAMRGCFVRGLLGRGAVCVVASLSRVDAFTASVFVGRLLTDIFNPFKPGIYHNFQEVFFATQYTTALLYDPLLPFLRRAQNDPETRRKLSLVLSDFFRWTHGRELEIRKHRYEIAWFLGEAILRHGLRPIHLAHLRSGIVRPETLLFSIFGVPTHVELKW